MALIVFFIFFVSVIQALVCRCLILGTLGLVCLVSAIVLCCTEQLPRWIRLLVIILPVIMLAVIIQRAGMYDALYSGNIIQYRVTIGYCLIAICCHLFFLVPETQKALPEQETDPS